MDSADSSSLGFIAKQREDPKVGFSRAPDLALPTDHRDRTRQAFAYGAVPFVIDDELTVGLNDLSRRHAHPLLITVLSGWALLLSRLSRQEDFAIGASIVGLDALENGTQRSALDHALALRIELSGSPTVQVVFERIKRAILEARHGSLYENITPPDHAVQEKAHPRTFQAMFVWQTDMADASIGGTPEAIISNKTFGDVELMLDLRQFDGCIVGEVQYAETLFNQETIKRWCGYLHNTLLQIVIDDQQIAGAMEVLPPEERHKLLFEWNETAGVFPSDLCVHELFEAQVVRTPSASAVIYEQQSLTYSELNARANRLAHHLVKLGLKPDSRVAICANRSLEMVVGLLAILKAGGAYLPLDPNYPVERLGFMLRDASPSAILTLGHARTCLEKAVAHSKKLTTDDPLEVALDLPIVDLTVDSHHWASLPASNPNAELLGLRSHHLAYIIYTSGSTGQPKGVMIEHQSVVNRLVWMQKAYPINCSDAVCQKTPFSFDVSVWEFFWTLMVGAKLIVAKPDGHRDANYLAELIQRENVTVCHFVPSMLGAFLANEFNAKISGLRMVFCSGEELSGRLVRRFHDVLSRSNLYNLYGPTEATVDVTAWKCEVPACGLSSSPLIGRPIENARIYLLDEFENPVPVGVSGEIYIGGVGVARGYLNRPDLTAERFVRSRFVEGDRLYRTGDLARYLPDGNIEFLGRNDFQVKIRGFRIELGEIEAQLARYPKVSEAVVLARDDNLNGKRLVAYYTANGNVALQASELRTYLTAALPAYMVPVAFVQLDSMPLTQNGKLDRKALPIPVEYEHRRADSEATTSPVEAILMQIWCEVLGVDGVGKHENFFDLGGHSLPAMRITARVRERFGVMVSMAVVFAEPTIALYASAIEKALQA